MKTTFLAVSLLFAALPAGAEERVLYPIKGASAGDLIRQMRQLGPRGYWAWTAARYQWTYQYRRTAGRCAIASANVTERITVTLPDWNDRSAAKPCLREGWERMMTRLSEHEMGHVRRWQGTEARVRAALLAVPPQASCEALGKLANDTGNATIAEVQAGQDEYDRQTNHGIATGVALRDC